MIKQNVIAIVNEKGGTGKTTTAVNLSASLGKLGKKVLLVDLDGQAASSRWYGIEEDNRLAEALCNGKGLEPIKDVAPNVSLAPASGKLDSVAHELRPTQGGQLRKLLANMEGYDYIFIDCPPSLGNKLIGNALLAAKTVLVPVETSILALDGLKILLTTLEDVRDGFDHQIELGGVLACRYDGRTRLSRLVLTELRRALPGKVMETVIRENVRMRECPASGESIQEFAPDSHAAEDYMSLAKEIMESPEIWLAQSIGKDMTDEQKLSVNNLRDNAAAKVRDGITKTSPVPPSANNEEQDNLSSSTNETMEVVAQVESEGEPDLGGNHDHRLAEPDNPVTKELEAWLVKLNEAEKRLEAEDVAETHIHKDSEFEGGMEILTDKSAASLEQDNDEDSSQQQPSILELVKLGGNSSQSTPQETQAGENVSESPIPAEEEPEKVESQKTDQYPALRAILKGINKESKIA